MHTCHDWIQLLEALLLILSFSLNDYAVVSWGGERKRGGRGKYFFFFWLLAEVAVLKIDPVSQSPNVRLQTMVKYSRFMITARSKSTICSWIGANRFI